MTEGGDDDEISALEEKLAALKQSKKEEEVLQTAQAAAERVPMVEVDDGFDWTTMSSRKKVAAMQSAAPGELLSEAWKESETDGPSADGEGGGFNLVAIVGAVLVTVGFIAFAQVPVGQTNLDTVTYGGKTTRVESPDEIRARYQQLTDEDE